MKAVELRQSILQAAVQGKLVPQNPYDEPASELLKRIQQEKIRLVKEGKLKKEKPMPSISADEIPYDLPEGWIWCRLGDLIYYSDAGKSPACKNSPASTNETGVIKTTAVQYGKFLPLENKVLPVNFQFDSRMLIHTDDILITRAGPQNRTGIACLVDKCDRALILSDKTVRLNCSGEFIYKPYIVTAINSLPIRKLLIEKMTGMAESQVNISQSNIAIILFPVPPLIEQQRIMTKVNELMLLCDALESEEKKLDALEAHFAEYFPKAILQVAVQGKLVPQNSHDEPASELLKRIQQEKAQLVKGEKLKKEKPLPPISEDEIPYDLPEGWEWCRLGEICNYGSTQNIQPDDIPVDAWILELEDIEKDTGKLLCKRSKLQRKPMSTKHCFLPNDILYSKLRPYLNKVLIAEDYGYCTSEILPLSFYGGLNVRYILNFLRSPLFVDYTNKCSYGVKMPRLGTNDGKTALVPLPPAEEQQRIVTKIDELIPFCDELKSAYTTPVKLKQVKTEIIPFPTLQKEPKTLLAARGDVGQLSNEAMQAINDLFAEDEE